MPVSLRNTTIFVVLALLVGACNPPAKLPLPDVSEKPLSQIPIRPRPVAKPVRYTAPEFLLHLTLAEIVMAKGGALEDIASHLKVIEGYAAQSPATPSPVTLAVLKYQTDTGNLRKEAAPIGATEQDFSALLAVLSQSGRKLGALQDITVVNVAVEPAPFVFKDMDSEQVHTALQGWQKKILSRASRPSVLDEAAAQLTLLRLFTEQRQKEAAYISADNTKRLLAEALQNTAVDEVHNQLTYDLEALEGQLRMAMPF